MSNFDNDTTVCANCGKGEEESVNLKKCVACHMVKYCNRDCQIAHVHSTRRNVKRGPQSYMMKSYSKRLSLTSVQSVCYLFRL